MALAHPAYDLVRRQAEYAPGSRWKRLVGAGMSQEECPICRRRGSRRGRSASGSRIPRLEATRRLAWHGVHGAELDLHLGTADPDVPILNHGVG